MDNQKKEQAIGVRTLALAAASISFKAALNTFQATGVGRPLARWLLNRLRAWCNGEPAVPPHDTAQVEHRGDIFHNQLDVGPHSKKPGE